MFSPSLYQQALFNEIKTGQGNIVLKAGPGSGKTTTIVQSLNIIPSNCKVLFLAFNKAIVNELESRIPKNTQAKTLNSFGLSLCFKNSGKRFIKCDGDKVQNIFKFDIMHLKKDMPMGEKAFITKLSIPVQKLVSLAKANMLLTPNSQDFQELAERYDIDLVRLTGEETIKLWDYAVTAFKISVNRLDIIDFDDQLFLPVYYNWKMPKYDYILVDEAQDLNPVQIEMIKRLSEV